MMTNPAVADPESPRRKILVTGAAGTIGSYFAEHARHRYELHLMVRGDERNIDRIRPWGNVVQADLSDLPRLKELAGGIDTVLHLAANPSPDATWSELLPNNIVGTYNMMVAARSAGCRRLIYASSIHAVSGYPRDVQVKGHDPVNPGDLYGVTKCFGEAMGRYMAEQEGLSVIALRIGCYQPVENGQKADSISMFDAFVSNRDLHQLIVKCIDDTKLRWAVFHGLSDNRYKRMDISDARELLGYAPQDDLTLLNPTLRPLDLRGKVQAWSLKDKSQRSGLRDEF